jgi:Zn-dependent protease with chaperone function/Tfp pilus assembly protein PilE
MSVATEAVLEPQPVDREALVYPTERPLYYVLFTIGAIFWLALVLATLGIALLYLVFGFIAYLFAHSALIAWIRGNGVKITPQQFPDLYGRYQQCCRKLGMEQPPEAYILNGQGVLNAFATKFVGRYFVVLNSNLVDAMMDKPGAVSFYMGHELGHIARGHLRMGPILLPGSLLPLLGAGYRRAQEYTCDAFGAACCSDREAAVHALCALAAGDKRWSVLNVPAYLEQAKDTSGFWMSFHELIADYPWTVKRVARVARPSAKMPGRNPLAWFFAFFIPRFGVGGSAVGGVMAVALVGVLAAIAIPAYQDYVARAKMSEVVSAGQLATRAVTAFYDQNGKLPQTLADSGFTQSSPAIKRMVFDHLSGVIEIAPAFAPVQDKTLEFVPKLDAQKRIQWRCRSDDIAPKYLPAQCR